MVDRVERETEAWLADQPVERAGESGADYPGGDFPNDPEAAGLHPQADDDQDESALRRAARRLFGRDEEPTARPSAGEGKGEASEGGDGTSGIT